MTARGKAGWFDDKAQLADCDRAGHIGLVQAFVTIRQFNGALFQTTLERVFP